MLLTRDDLVAAEREHCRRSFARFVKRAWRIVEPGTKLKWGWALDCLSEHLEAVSNGEIRRLLINVPPGMMKSLTVGIFFPAWEWGPRNMPHHRYLGTAHSEKLAIRDSTRCRRLIQSEWFQSRWPIKLTGDQNAKTKFENDAMGFREAMAFTSLTGSRGSRIIIDDPHSVDDAKSIVKLESDVETFRESVPSRVNDENSAIIIIMQRLAEGDVSAQALDLGYEHLCLPMRYEPGASRVVVGPADPRTQPDELLFPERFSEAAVAELEESLGAHAAAGQLQQRPGPKEGNDFKADKIEIIDALPAGLRFARGWDLAATKRKTSDYTASVKMAVKDGFVYIAEVTRDRMSPDEVEAAIKIKAQSDGREAFTSLPQDPGQAGVAQARRFSQLLAGHSFEVTLESGDKRTRAGPFAAQVNAGNVRMLRGTWNDAYTAELKLFPDGGKHDDQVDASSRAYNYLTGTDEPARSIHISWAS